MEWLSGKVLAVLQWFFATVLARIGRWMGLAFKIWFWVVCGLSYVFLLFTPEVCSAVINVACWFAYQLSYQILHLAAGVYFLALYLGAAARFIRNIAPVHGVFEY